MSIRRALTIVLAVAALGLVPSTGQAKSCSSGFVHGYINGAEKCLRAGEYCAHAYDHRAASHWPYTHYGYRCVRRDSRGSYHLTYS
jgi:hypothetical protein